MAVTADRPKQTPIPIAPLHALLLGGSITLFIAAMLSDMAYSSSYEIQWNNFASWLIAGALVLCALTVVWGFVNYFRTAGGRPRTIVYPVLMLITWVVGFFNALMHARDAYASMPTGLVLSVIVVLLACVATWVGFSMPRTGDHS